MNAESVASALGRHSRKAGGGVMACCPAHDDRNPSLSLDDGDDGRLLVKCMAGCSQQSVVEALKARGLWPSGNTDPLPPLRKARTSQIWKPLLPIPADAPPPPAAHPQHGKPSMTWRYCDQSGALLGYVYRFDTGDKKEIIPLTFCTDGTRSAWRWQSFPKPRPLYGLELLRGSHVVIPEGEKATDAARLLLGDRLPVITWPGGCNAVSCADWSPLAGLTVAVVPDADAPGIKAAHAVADELVKVGAKSIKVVIPPDDVAEGWDLADAEVEGWTGDKVLELLRSGVSVAEFRARFPREESGGADGTEEADTSGKAQSSLAWPELSQLALPGIVGDFIRAACEHSEADPAAILTTFLVRFAIQCGPSPHVMVGDTRHHARINAVIVGDSSKARKGTSAGPVDAVFTATATPCRVTPGPLSTGEGIIFNVRDEQQTWVIDRKTNEGAWQVTDPGVTDKRLFVQDEEFAAALQSTRREGNTLSSVIRTLFDSGNAEPLTKGNRCKATGAHVGIVTHITIGELLKLLNETEQVNGFGNRFLWALARRQKKVPFPKGIDAGIKSRVAWHIDQAVRHAEEIGALTFDQDAARLWAEEYSDLSEAVEGRAGHMVGRGEAIVIRLALIYALIAMHQEIKVDDLRAALALWDYCQHSALYLFAGSGPTTKRRKKILELIDVKGWASKSDLLAGLGGHIKAETLDDLLNDLEQSGLITVESVRQPGGTKPVTIVKRSANYPNYPNYPPRTGENSESSENSHDVFSNAAGESSDNSENSHSDFENAAGDDVPEFDW